MSGPGWIALALVAACAAAAVVCLRAVLRVRRAERALAALTARPESAMMARLSATLEALHGEGRIVAARLERLEAEAAQKRQRLSQGAGEATVNYLRDSLALTNRAMTELEAAERRIVRAAARAALFRAHLVAGAFDAAGALAEAEAVIAALKADGLPGLRAALASRDAAASFGETPDGPGPLAAWRARIAAEQRAAGPVRPKLAVAAQPSASRSRPLTSRSSMRP